MLLQPAHLWRNWSDLTEIVRGDDNFYDFTTPDRSDEEVEAFIGAMDVVARKMEYDIAKQFLAHKWPKRSTIPWPT